MSLVSRIKALAGRSEQPDESIHGRIAGVEHIHAVSTYTDAPQFNPRMPPPIDGYTLWRRVPENTLPEAEPYTLYFIPAEHLGRGLALRALRPGHHDSPAVGDRFTFPRAPSASDVFFFEENPSQGRYVNGALRL